MKVPYKIIIGKQLSSQEKVKVKDSIEEIFHKIDKELNPFNPHSTLTRFNSGQKISSWLLQHAILLGLRMAIITKGSFDPAVAIFNGDKFAFKIDPSKTQFDLCGIAKGLTVDIIGKKLKKYGYKNFLIDWGGDILAQGSHPQKNGWVIQILGRKDPYILHDEAIASSGSYFTKECVAKNGRSHIINSATKTGVQLKDKLFGASCIAKNCATADGIATALIADSKNAKQLAKDLQKSHDVTIFLIQNNLH